MQVHCVCWNEMVSPLLHRQHSAHCLLEGHCHIGGILGTGLIVGVISILLAPLPRILGRHLPLRYIHLVSQDHEGELLGLLDVRIIDKLLLPVAHVQKTLAVVHAEGEQAAVGAPVERSPQAAEALLAGRVPDLQGDHVAVYLQVLVEELHADGVEEVCVEFVGDVAVHEGTLPHAAVTQEDHFEKGCFG